MNDQSIFLTKLPSEIITNILSRLPVRTITTCKCVCKPWLELLASPEFAKFHLSKSAPGLVVSGCGRSSNFFFEIFDFEDEHKLEHHEFLYNSVTKINLAEFIRRGPRGGLTLSGTVNGLLCLRYLGGSKPDTLYICNPITREYIALPRSYGIYKYPQVVTLGFGVSKISDQYKVVRIFHESEIDPETGSCQSIPYSDCQVYTLGTGSWRSIGPIPPFYYSCRFTGTFLNGNLHWLVGDLKDSRLISCFDLDKEVFKTFSAPPLPGWRSFFLGDLSVLGDCLCVCDNTSHTDIVIWVMKEYGLQESWTKEFVLSKSPDLAGECYEVVYPIKVFKNGDILMIWYDFHLFYYSSQSKTTSSIDRFSSQSWGCIEGMLHISSFLSLKSFAMEKAISF